MTDTEKIIQMLTTMQSDIKGIHHRMDGFEDRMTGFENRMDRMESRMDNMELRMGDMEGRQGSLEQHLVRMENDLNKKIDALFDAFELRGDQITRLEKTMHDRLTYLENSNTHLIQQVAIHDMKIQQLERAIV